MDKYDGWTLKSPGVKRSYLLGSFVHTTRKEVIEHIDKVVVEGYKKWKRGVGKDYQIVKVKLVEVE